MDRSTMANGPECEKQYASVALEFLEAMFIVEGGPLNLAPTVPCEGLKERKSEGGQGYSH